MRLGIDQFVGCMRKEVLSELVEKIPICGVDEPAQGG